MDESTILLSLLLKQHSWEEEVLPTEDQLVEAFTTWPQNEIGKKSATEARRKRRNLLF